MALQVTRLLSILSLPSSISLQHATGIKPCVIGKPSSAYFNAALKELGVTPDMVSHYSA